MRVGQKAGNNGGRLCPAAGMPYGGEQQESCPQVVQRHQLRGLHIDQHGGVPQQAILACEAVAQVQNGSETGLWHGSLQACQGRARESGRCAISRR